ncbi:MAG: biopolymer transporter ExbD [Calditrichia bacterium]
MQLLEKKKKGLQINLTSLIDVMFILIIFYSVTSTFMEQPGLELNLPEASNTQVAQIKDNVLFVYPDSSIYLDKKVIPLDSLGIALEQLKLKSASGNLILQADERIPNGFIVKLMDIASQKGFEQLTISTQEGK